MRRPSRRTLAAVLALALTLPSALVVSCGDDDDGGSYPSVLNELVEVEVGADSTVTAIRTDGGTTYAVSQRVTAQTADTVLRCLCTYLPAADASPATATLYQLQTVFSEAPRPRADFADTLDLPRDPVRLLSAWKTARWINLYVGTLTHLNVAHAFAFCADSLVADTTTGRSLLCVSLLHRQPDDDAPDFTRKVYLSLPVAPCAAQADSLVLRVVTTDGERLLPFSLR